MTNNRFYLIELFDIYKDLLTDKQINYFQDYYLNDLSLSELADINQVSRNAVLDSISKTEKILLNYESKLQLCEQKKQIYDILNKNDNIESVKEKLGLLRLFK